MAARTGKAPAPRKVAVPVAGRTKQVQRTVGGGRAAGGKPAPVVRGGRGAAKPATVVRGGRGAKPAAAKPAAAADGAKKGGRAAKADAPKPSQAELDAEMDAWMHSAPAADGAAAMAE